MKRIIFAIVFICISLFSYSQSYWYYGTVEDLENGSAPSAKTAITYTNEMYKTYDATQSAWYNLDTSVERLRIPYAVGDYGLALFCIAVPVSSGINDVLNTLQTESLIGGSLTQSNKTINGIDYIVWTGRTAGRLGGYLINSNPHSNSYWYYGTVEDLENGSAPSAKTAITYTNEMYKTYTHTKSTWYKLDTSIEKLKVPYAEGDIINKLNCVAVPVSSGFNDLVDTDGIVSLTDRGMVRTNKTINGIDYIVWYNETIGRIMGYLINSNPHSNSYWYYGTVDDLNNGSSPSAETAISYTNDDYKTFDATQSAWYNLDTSVEKLRIPYATFLSGKYSCIAVPVSSGINDVLNVTQSESLIGGSLTQSNKTINGVEYIVWTGRTPGRFTGYLINSNPTSGEGSTTLTDNGIIFDLKDDGTLEVIGLETWAKNADILSDVTIGGKTYRVTSIKAWAFKGRSDLQYLSIPWTVTSIGEYAFIDCGSNIMVNIADPECWCQMQLGNEHASPLSSAGKVLVHDIETTSIDIPETVTSIGKFTFYQCRKIKSLNIPSSVKSISSSAFEDCTGLTALTLSEGLETLGGSAFEGCTGLKSLKIPSTVNTIKINAFKNCKAITDVYCYAQKVPDTDDAAFDGTPTESATLHVSKGCSDAYKAKAPWKNFKNIVEMVDAKVKLSKTKAAIEKGKTLTLKATITPSDLADKSVTWKSSNTKVATVTSKGKVKGVKAGTATITCISNSTGAKATCKVTVGYVKLDQSEVSVKKGKTVTLKATVYPSSLTDKSVTWESSNTKIATVTSKGKVKGVKAGTATITCTSNATGLKTTCEVTVGYVKLDQTEVTVKKGKTVTLKATVYPSSLEDKSVTWESSNTKVATVSSKGKVKGIKAGTATITCTSNATGLSTTCIVTVGYVKLDQTEVTVKKGKTVTLTATVYPSSLEDKSVTWESSNTKVATVTSKGKVKGVKAGTVTITCTSNATSLSTTCIVTVTATAGSRSLEGDDDELTEIDEVEASAAIEPFDVYDLSGRKVLHQVTSLDGLSDGIYIVNGKKILKK